MSWKPNQAQVPRPAEIKLLKALLQQDNLNHYDFKTRHYVSPSVINLWLPRFIDYGFATMKEVKKGMRVSYSFSLTEQGKVWALRRIEDYQFEQDL